MKIGKNLLLTVVACVGLSTLQAEPASSPGQSYVQNQKMMERLNRLADEIQNNGLVQTLNNLNGFWAEAGNPPATPEFASGDEKDSAGGNLVCIKNGVKIAASPDPKLIGHSIENDPVMKAAVNALKAGDQSTHKAHFSVTVERPDPHTTGKTISVILEGEAFGNKALHVTEKTDKYTCYIVTIKK